MNRRVGLPVVLLILFGTVVVLWGATRLVRGLDDGDPAATASPGASSCEALRDPYGSPPDGVIYAKVDEGTREKTVKALALDEAGGRVDMRAARQGSVTLGTLVGVPNADPEGYVDDLVLTAERGGSPVASGDGFSMIPLRSGTLVAVGAKGCMAILISAADPRAVRFLATAVFGE